MELSKILKIILKLISKCSSKNKHVWCNNIIINEKIMYAWFPIFFIDISSSLLKILLGIVIGILFNEFLGMSYLTLGLSVGTTVTIMMYFKIIHPPAAANPLIALFADVSLGYIVFPVIVGSIVIIVLSVIINRYLLKRNYPVRWF